MQVLKTTLILGALLAGLAGAKEVTTQIPVSGMTCGSCAVAVRKALTSVEGVKKADVSVEQNKATVVYEDHQVSEKQLREAINKTGFRAETATPSISGTHASTDQVSFYKVPLACPAARNLGCGSAAKPVLSVLEQKSTIQEAWLDHPGTTLAIVWRKDATADSRAADLRSLVEARHMSLEEITGGRRDEISKIFLSRDRWYRGAEVDQLSAEESNIIVDRWIRRAATKVPAIATKSESLRPALAKVIQERFIGKDNGKDGYQQRLD